MEGSNTNYYSVGDILRSGKNFSRYLLKRWWILSLAALLGGIFGLLYYYAQKPKYRAETTFILEDKSSGNSGLAGLASQFGFSMGNFGSGGSIFGGDNILSILKSKKIVEHVLLTLIDSTNAEKKTLADLYLDFNGYRTRWKKNPNLAGISFTNFAPLNRIQDSVLNLIHERIIRNDLTTERASKQGTIIKVQLVASEPIFARLMAERLVNESSKLYMNIRTGNFEANVKELQRRSDSLLILLNRKSFAAAASQPLDVNPAIRTAAVPVEIATRDKTVLATLYAEVTKNLEASKMLLSQQTPVIQVLDVPGLALKDNRRGKLFTCVAGIFYGVFSVLLVLFLTFLLNSYVKKDDAA